jgi:hypothetical protein
MKFAQRVFTAAGIWGLLVVFPLYFLFDEIGRKNPPAITHPDFFFGFIAVTLAWQVAFLVIATDPGRYRLLIFPAMLEKFGYVATLLVLYTQGRVPSSSLVFAVIDGLLGILFLVSFFKAKVQPSAVAAGTN